MAPTTTNQPVAHKELETFLSSSNPSIPFVTPSSEDYAEVRFSFVVNPDANPSLIVRPQTIDQVVHVVSYIISHKISFAIRGGGHDFFARSFPDGGVTVDMRSINHAEIDRQSMTAKVGGGVLMSDLASTLHEHGLATPTGSIGDVGYVGWAMYGGYGPFSCQAGLGVDQILAARVIDARGELIDADEKLLKAIRGAGGAFSVIVEVTIPVLVLDKVCLSGCIVWRTKTGAEYNRSLPA